jgi:Tol biopolymer transport system component
MSRSSPSPHLPLLVATSLLAAGRSGPLAQNEKLSVLPLGSTGGVFGHVVAGERVVYTTASQPLATGGKLWSLRLDRSSPPAQLHDEDAQGPLHDFHVTPDGVWTLLRVQQDRIRLRAVRTDGSAAGAFVSGSQAGDVLDLRITPDSTRVVFRSDAAGDGVLELWVRPVDNSGPLTRLSAPLVTGGHVAEFHVSPDGAWVVYRADQDTDGVHDLYAVPLDGSGPVRRLNASRPLADVEEDFAIAFDSLGVVYRADQDTDGVIELYGVRIDGLFGSFKRSGALVAGGDVVDFRLSPADDRITYRADQALDGRNELYSVAAIAGGTPVRLNGPLPSGGNVESQRFDLDGERVLYVADQDVNGVDELWSAPADGAAPAVKLHASLTAPQEVGEYWPSPDHTSVLFTADLAVSRAVELYRAPLDGSAPPLRLSPAFDPGVEVRSIAFDSDGSDILYLADVRADRVPELYAVPADGSRPAAHLNRTLVTGGVVHAAQVLPGDASVLYVAEQRDGFENELFRVPLDGTAPPLLMTDPFPRGAPEGDVRDFELAWEQREVVVTTVVSPSELDTWRVALDGRPRAERITGPGVAEELRGVSPDGRHAVFAIQTRIGPGENVISRRVDGSAPPVWLDRDLAGTAGAPVLEVAFTPDSSRVLFVTSTTPASPAALCSAHPDGSQSAQVVDTHVAESSPVSEFRHLLRISPDSTRVAYLRSEPASAPPELWSARVDGSEPPVRLSAPLPAGGAIGGEGTTPAVALTPDGTRAVYLGEQDTDGVVELYGVPLDGSAPPVKLNGPLVAGGGVRGTSAAHVPFQVSPDGAFVVYVADQDTDEVLELYRAPVLGGVPPVKLSGALVAGGSVVGPLAPPDGSDVPLLLSPDGQWVVYRADATTDDVTEIYAVRSDGSAPPVRLNAPLAPGGHVVDFRLEPTSRRAVYRTRPPSGLVEIHSAPLDGSAPAVLVSSTGAFFPVLDRGYDVTPDGARVVFTAALDDPDFVELYIAPIEPGAAPLKLNGPLVANGNVLSAQLRITPDGSRVLYLADQDVNGQVELYTTFLDHRPRGAVPPGRTVLR